MPAKVVRKRKPAAKPDFAARQNAANARASRAISIFEHTAKELEESANAQDALAEEIHKEVERLTALRDRANADADSAFEVAHKIRSLVS